MHAHTVSHCDTAWVQETWQLINHCGNARREGDAGSARERGREGTRECEGGKARGSEGGIEGARGREREGGSARERGMEEWREGGREGGGSAR